MQRILQLWTVFPTLYFICDIYFAADTCFVLNLLHLFLPYIPSPLKPTSLFSVFINSAPALLRLITFFKISHINEIIQYLSFSHVT